MKMKKFIMIAVLALLFTMLVPIYSAFAADATIYPEQEPNDNIYTTYNSSNAPAESYVKFVFYRWKQVYSDPGRTTLNAPLCTAYIDYTEAYNSQNSIYEFDLRQVALASYPYHHYISTDYLLFVEDGTSWNASRFTDLTNNDNAALADPGVSQGAVFPTYPDYSQSWISEDDMFILPDKPYPGSVYYVWAFDPWPEYSTMDRAWTLNTDIGEQLPPCVSLVYADMKIAAPSELANEWRTTSVSTVGDATTALRHPKLYVISEENYTVTYTITLIFGNKNHQGDPTGVPENDYMRRSTKFVCTRDVTPAQAVPEPVIDEENNTISISQLANGTSTNTNDIGRLVVIGLDSEEQGSAFTSEMDIDALLNDPNNPYEYNQIWETPAGWGDPSSNSNWTLDVPNSPYILVMYINREPTMYHQGAMFTRVHFRVIPNPNYVAPTPTPEPTEFFTVHFVGDEGYHLPCDDVRVPVGRTTIDVSSLAEYAGIPSAHVRSYWAEPYPGTQLDSTTGYTYNIQWNPQDGDVVYIVVRRFLSDNPNFDSVYDDYDPDMTLLYDEENDYFYIADGSADMEVVSLRLEMITFSRYSQLIQVPKYTDYLHYFKALSEDSRSFLTRPMIPGMIKYRFIATTCIGTRFTLWDSSENTDYITLSYLLEGPMVRNKYIYRLKVPTGVNEETLVAQAMAAPNPAALEAQYPGENIIVGYVDSRPWQLPSVPTGSGLYVDIYFINDQVVTWKAFLPLL